jgi:hypothetical protein
MATLRVGEPLPDGVLYGAGERKIRLAELHADGPAVFVFLRHFG